MKKISLWICVIVAIISIGFYGLTTNADADPEKTFTLYEAGVKLGDYDTFTEVENKMQEYYNTKNGLTGKEWMGPPTEYNYIIDVNKDVYLENNVTIGWPFHQHPNIILKSKDSQNPVTIRGKGFSNGMIQVVGESQLIIQDIIFDAEKKGTIFNINAGNAYHSKESEPFSYVSRPSHLIIEHGAILENGKGDLGGAIYADRYSRITMNGGEIKNSEADRVGGAICSLSWVHDRYWDRNSNKEVLIPDDDQKPCLTITGGKIDGNSAKNGGAIYIQDSDAQKSVAVISGGEITENSAVYGGGVYAGRGANLTISGGKINKNSSATSGGGLEVDSTSVVKMIDGEILGNRTDNYGGGVCVDDTATFTMNGGRVSENIAGKFGGGVYPFNKDAVCELKGGTISKNGAPYGGGICNGSLKTRIGAVNITENTGEKQGGGIYLFKPCEIDGAIIFKNLSSQGGGININVENLTIKNTILNENRAEHGGGLYIQKPFKLENVTINANEALAGGGIFLGIGDGKIQKLNNTIKITNNEAAINGGGIYIKDGTLQIDESNIIGNIADNKDFLDEQYKNDINQREGSGGGIYVSETGALNISGAKLNSNKSYFGGAISTKAPITITGANFSENEAYNVDIPLEEGQVKPNLGHGGAIYVYKTLPKGTEVLIDNTSFENNIASLSGGAISINETNALVKVINSSKFEGNHTTDTENGVGGAIYTNLHAYHPEYDNGSTGNIEPTPDPNVYYTNINTDKTTIFTGNKAFRTFTPPPNKAAFTKLLFASTSNPGTDYNHILNNDDVNIKNLKQVTFYMNFEAKDPVHKAYLILEGDTFGENFPSDPVRDGYKFKEWNTKADGTGEVITKEQIKNLVINENKAYYAIWDKEPTPIPTPIPTPTPTPTPTPIPTPNKPNDKIIPLTPLEPSKPIEPNVPEDTQNKPIKPNVKEDNQNKPVPNKKVQKIPKTGYTNNVALYGTILVLSGIGAVALGFYRKKSNSNK